MLNAKRSIRLCSPQARTGAGGIAPRADGRALASVERRSASIRRVEKEMMGCR